MSYDSEVAADSPLTYLKFDETTGTTAADSSGNSRPGTINGSPTLGATKVMPAGSTSFTLDTTAKRVDIAYAAWMDPAAWTAEAWVRLPSISGTHALVSRDGGSGSRGWNLRIVSSKIECNNGATSVNGTTTLTSATAYHLAMTWDGTTAKLYIDGVLDQSSALTMPTTSNPLIVGASTAGSAGFWFESLSGDIDHVAYYGTALSAARLLAHYNAGVAADASGTGSLSLTGSGAIGPAFGTGSLSLSGSGAGHGVASGAGALSLSATGTAEVLYATDASNLDDGLSLGGLGTVTITRPIAATPAGLSVGVKVDASVPLPTPTMVDGRPT